MSDENAEQQFIEQTRTWVENFIVGYNICPFARRELERGSIRYSVILSTHLAECLESLVVECERLDKDRKIETTLVIFPYGFKIFDDYLELLEIAEKLLVEQGYEGIYQLASFHPDYCFADTSPSDPTNYTNRSPYPMLHLIREESIDRALRSYSKPEEIPLRNMELARRLGEAELKQILDSCCKSNSGAVSGILNPRIKKH